MVGIVTNLNDPSTLNRIKVKFPALSDADESNWARIVNPMAGGQAGWVSMPAIGDEVLVGFEHGDFRRPYVLGSLYNGKDKPPYAVAGGKVLKHGFKTLGAHEMIFNDEANKESISLIHGKSDHTAPIEQFRLAESALSRNSKVYETLVKADEGHGFYKTADQEEAYNRMKAFLLKYNPPN